MKARIESLLEAALLALEQDGEANWPARPAIPIVRSKTPQQGDYSSTAALILAKQASCSAMLLAESIVERLPASEWIDHVEVKSPGFINFFCSHSTPATLLGEVFGKSWWHGRSHSPACNSTLILFNPATESAWRMVLHAALLARLFEGCRMSTRSLHFHAHQKTKTQAIDWKQYVSGLEANVLQASQPLQSIGKVMKISTQTSEDRAIVLCGRHEAEAAQRVFGLNGVTGRESSSVVLLPVEAVSSPDNATAHQSIRSEQQYASLLDRVGHEALLMSIADCPAERQLSVDVEKYTQHSVINPLYCVQLACARVSSLVRQQEQQALQFSVAQGLRSAHLLTSPIETQLMMMLEGYPELVLKAVEQLKPYQLTRYLRVLADSLHRYYSQQNRSVHGELRQSRVCLMIAVQRTLANGLSLMGISTPEVM